MTSASKRVQVVLRSKVLEILEGISADENLSMSKVCSLLIEEALLARGVFSKTSHIREHLPPSPERDSVMRRDSLVKAAEDLGLNVETAYTKTETQDPELEDDDLRLLKKIKMLKELNLL